MCLDHGDGRGDAPSTEELADAGGRVITAGLRADAFHRGHAAASRSTDIYRGDARCSKRMGLLKADTRASLLGDDRNANLCRNLAQRFEAATRATVALRLRRLLQIVE